MSLPDEKRCKYKGCGLYFSSHSDVIKHIEAEHLCDWEEGSEQNTPGLFQKNFPDQSLLLPVTIKNMLDSPQIREFKRVDARWRSERNLIGNLDSTNKFVQDYLINEFYDHFEEAQISNPIVMPMSVIQKYSYDSEETPPIGKTNNPEIDKYEFEPLPNEPSLNNRNTTCDKESMELLKGLQILLKNVKEKYTRDDQNFKFSIAKLKRRTTRLRQAQALAQRNKCRSPRNDAANDYYSKDFILKASLRHVAGNTKFDCEDRKPFICRVPGCTKAYKNANGIRYHATNSHKGPPNLGCAVCGIICKTVQGLASHMTRHFKKKNPQVSLMCYEKIPKIEQNQNQSVLLAEKSSDQRTIRSFKSAKKGIRNDIDRCPIKQALIKELEEREKATQLHTTQWRGSNQEPWLFPCITDIKAEIV